MNENNLYEGLSMKKYIVVALSIAALLTMSGCSKNDDDGTSGGSSGTGGDTSQKTKYEGTWQGASGVTLVVDGTTLQLTLDNTEEGVHSHIEGVGSFSIEGTKTIQPNNKTVDKVIHHLVTCNAEMTLSTTEYVSSFNSTGVCGGGWQINTVKDISNCTFPGESSSTCSEIQMDEKDIFLLEGNKLYSGDIDLDVDAAGYPNALDTDFMTKQ